MSNKLIFEQRPKYNIQKKVFKYWGISNLYMISTELLFVFMLYYSQGQFSFNDIKTGLYFFLIQAVAIFIVALIVSLCLRKYYSSCVYRLYNNRIEIQTSSKIVLLKYSAIQDIELSSVIKGISFANNNSVATIQIKPILQQGRKISKKYGYNDFVYYLHNIEHAKIFVAELNKLRDEYISSLKR